MAVATSLRAPKAAVGRATRRAKVQARRTHQSWGLTFNLGRRLQHRRSPLATDERSIRLADTLAREGMVAASWDEVFGPDQARVFTDLQAEAAAELDRRVDEVREARALVGDDSADRDWSGKEFMIRLRDQAKGFDPATDADPYLAVARHPALVGVVERYLGMRATLAYCNTWLCVPTPADDAAHLWHRDPEDRHIVKVFIYLSDVAEPNGPFHYATGSHPSTSRKDGRPQPRRGPEPRYDDEAMAELVPRDRWREAAGPIGTVLFADTAGYHKGPNRTEDRLTFVASYVTGAAVF